MTKLELAMAADPSVSIQSLVLYHCPFEYGLENDHFPTGCPDGEWPCLKCWNAEVSE